MADVPPSTSDSTLTPEDPANFAWQRDRRGPDTAGHRPADRRAHGPRAETDDSSATAAGTACHPAKLTVDPGARFLLFAAVPSWLLSMILHVLLLLGLALLTLPPQVTQRDNEIELGNAEETVAGRCAAVRSPEPSNRRRPSN